MIKRWKAHKAIYKDIEFKSQTEARTAIFFDRLDTEWQYEVEAFKLPTISYKPDFYLPEFKIFYEVKPFQADFVEKLKAKELCEATGYAVLISDGIPRIGWQGFAYSYQKGCSLIDDEKNANGEVWFDSAVLVDDESFLFSQYPDYDKSREMWIYLHNWRHNAPCYREDGIYKPYPIRHPFCYGGYDLEYTEDATKKENLEWMIGDAVKAARNAQFDNNGYYIER